MRVLLTIVCTIVILASSGCGGGNSDHAAAPAIPAHGTPTLEAVELMTVASGDPVADTLEVPVVAGQVVVIHRTMNDTDYAAFRSRMVTAIGTIAGWDRDVGWLALTTRTGTTIAAGIASVEGDPDVLAASANVVFDVGEPSVAAPAAVAAGMTDVYGLPYDTPSSTYAINHDWNKQTSLDALATMFPARVLYPVGVMDSPLYDYRSSDTTAGLVPSRVLDASFAKSSSLDPTPNNPHQHSYDVLNVICGRRDEEASKWLRGMLPQGSAVFAETPTVVVPITSPDLTDVGVVNKIGVATYLELLDRFGTLMRKTDQSGRQARVFNLSFALTPLQTKKAPIYTAPSDGNVANSMGNTWRGPADAREESILALALQHARVVAGGIAIVAKEHDSLIVMAEGNWGWSGDTRLLPDPWVMGASEKLYQNIAAAYASNVILVSDTGDGLTHGFGVTDISASGKFMQANGTIYSRGTSFAAPAVASIAEAIWSALDAIPAAHPTPASVKHLVVASGSAGIDGIPNVDAAAAVAVIDTYRGLNHAPTTSDVSFEIQRPNTPYDITIPGADADGDGLSIHIDSAPAYGTAIGFMTAGLGTIRYTQVGTIPDVVSSDHLTFHYTDSRGAASAVHTLTIVFGTGDVVVPTAAIAIDGSTADWTGHGDRVAGQAGDSTSSDPALDFLSIAVAQGALVGTAGDPRVGEQQLFVDVAVNDLVTRIMSDEAEGTGISVYLRYGTIEQGQTGVAIYEISYIKQNGRFHSQFQHRAADGTVTTTPLDNTYVRSAGTHLEMAIPMAWLGTLQSGTFMVYARSHDQAETTFDHVGEDCRYSLR